MTIYRAPRPDSGFTIIRNEVVRDSRLSLKARGLLLLILSRPDNWVTTAEQLAEENKEGRAAILSAFKELRAVGYMRQRRERDAQGRVRTITSVFDSPELGEPGVENLTPVLTREDDALPLVEPEAGFPTSDDLTPYRSTEKENQKKPTLTVLRPRATKQPEDWRPNGNHARFAEEHGLDMGFQAAQFSSHHEAKGSRFVSWDAAFRTWLGNSAEWSRPQQAVNDLPEWMR